MKSLLREFDEQAQKAIVVAESLSFDFDKELVEKRIHTLNPKVQIFYISAKKDEGFESWINYLKEKMKEWEEK